MSPANDDVETWFNYFDQLRGCVHNVRTGLPAAPDQLPQFFCTLLLAGPPLSEIKENTIRSCMNGTTGRTHSGDFCLRPRHSGPFIDRRAALKPRVHPRRHLSGWHARQRTRAVKFDGVGVEATK